MHSVHLTASICHGGPERQMIGLARALFGKHRTSFLTFAEGGRCDAFLAAARRHSIPATALCHDTPHFGAAIGEIADFLARSQADVLLCHGYKANLLGRVAARRRGVPVIAVSRGWTGENLKVRLYELLDRWHLRWMDRVACVSTAQAMKVQRAGVPAARIEVIVNSVDPARFDEPHLRSRAELLGFFADRPVHLVGAVGRLSPEKGFDILVSAAARVISATPETGFLVFGEGSCRLELERQIKSAGLDGRMVLAGFHEGLDRLLSSFDMLVLPSFTEGMPNVVLEAMAAGVPVVATAVGGTPEVIEDGRSGLLVPAGDPAALAARIQQVLGSADLAASLRAKARDRVREHFTFAAQARLYCRLFTEIAGCSKSASEESLAGQSFQAADDSGAKFVLEHQRET